MIKLDRKLPSWTGKISAHTASRYEAHLKADHMTKQENADVLLSLGLKKRDLKAEKLIKKGWQLSSSSGVWDSYIFAGEDKTKNSRIIRLPAKSASASEISNNLLARLSTDGENYRKSGSRTAFMASFVVSKALGRKTKVNALIDERVSGMSFAESRNLAPKEHQEQLVSMLGRMAEQGVKVVEPLDSIIYSPEEGYVVVEGFEMNNGTTEDAVGAVALALAA